VATEKTYALGHKHMQQKSKIGLSLIYVNY